jgi:hypothetical protein
VQCRPISPALLAEAKIQKAFKKRWQQTRCLQFCFRFAPASEKHQRKLMAEDAQPDDKIWPYHLGDSVIECQSVKKMFN